MRGISKYAIVGIIIAVVAIAGVGAWYYTTYTATPKKLTIYFFEPAPGNPWWDLVPHGIEMAIKDVQSQKGVTIEYKRFDATTLDQQISQLQNAISLRPNVAIVGPISDAVQDILKQLRQAGTIVILVDRDVPDQTARDLYLGTNNRYAAKFVAENFLKSLQERGVNPPYNVIIFKGLPGIPTSYLRYQGFMDALKPLVDQGKVKILAEVEVDPDNFQECYSKAQTIVASYGAQATVWFATNNLQAMAIVKALQDAGYKTGQDKYICGFDAQPSDWLNMIKQGIVSMSVTQTPHLMGYWGVWAGYAIWSKQVNLPPKAYVNTPIYSVLPCNATVVANKIDYLTVGYNELSTLLNQLTPSNPGIQAPSYYAEPC